MLANFTKKTSFPILLICLLLFCLAGCKKDKFKVDVSAIEVNPQFIRFDKQLAAIDTNTMEAGFKKLSEQYPVFFPAYYKNVLELVGFEDSAAPKRLKELINFEATQELNRAVAKKFGDVEEYNNLIRDAYKHHRYYYPKDSLPDIIYYTGLLNFGCIFFGNAVGVGLDLYLGKDYPYEKIATLYNYQIAKMYPEYIARNVMYLIGDDKFSEVLKGKRFIDLMIHEGKLAYYLDAILPNTPDSIKIGLNSRQLKWCKKNEYQIWQHIVDPKLKLLYNTEFMTTGRYFEEGPLTNAPGVQNEPEPSSPRFAVWTGREIVRKYMDAHPEITLPQLMEETDSDKILRESKYRP